MAHNKGLRMKHPTHPVRFVKAIILEPLGISVTTAAKALGVTRVALSRLIHEQAPYRPKWPFDSIRRSGPTWKP